MLDFSIIANLYVASFIPFCAFIVIGTVVISPALLSVAWAVPVPFTLPVETSTLTFVSESFAIAVISYEVKVLLTLASYLPRTLL